MPSTKFPTNKAKVTIQGQRFVTYRLCVSHDNSKIDKGNLIKLHRKIKENEKVCHAQNLGSHDLGQGYSPRSKVCPKSYISHNSKTDKGNLIKLHRKIRQNEKGCCA